MKQAFRGILAGLALTAGLAGASAPAHAQEAMLGEVREFGFNFCPRGWLPTDGRLLPISSNQALFSLLGTRYGGDGRTTFALPKFTPATAAAAPAPQPVGGEARIYRDCAYEGWNIPLGLGEYRSSALPSPEVDNNISAVRLSAGWEMTLYDGPNLDGASITVKGDNQCLLAQNFNDRASSFVIRRTPVAIPTAAPPTRDVMTCMANSGIFPSRN